MCFSVVCILFMLFLCSTFELQMLPDEPVTILPNMVNIKRFEEKIHGNCSGKYVIM